MTNILEKKQKIMDRYKTIHEIEKAIGFKLPIAKDLQLLTGLPEIDIFELDQTFCENDPDSQYFPEFCLYKGRVCSMNDYILIRYGNEILDKFKTLLK